MESERVFLFVVFVALVAVIITHAKPALAPATAGDAGITDPGFLVSGAEGPSYMTYNAPWFFAPPVGAFLPSQASGDNGNAVTVGSTGCNDCGG